MTERASKKRFVLGCVLVVVGIAVIVVGFIFPFHFYLTAWTHYENTITIDPYGRLKIDQNYFMGGIIRGQIIVSTVSNSTLVFYIEDSNGKTVVGPREINDEIKFEFHPQETSFYTIVFDNMGGESRSIFFITWQYYYNVLFTIIGIIIFFVGIILIIMNSKGIINF
jgi:hypothetical protein